MLATDLLSESSSPADGHLPLVVQPGAGIQTQKIRVLHVINGEHYAGAERVQDLLAQRLPEWNVDVGFVCLKPGRFAQSRHSQSTPLTNLPMRTRLDLRTARRLSVLIKQEQFDLIHTHTPRAALVGSLAARMAGVPMVHHVHGHTATEVGASWRNWLSAHAERLSLSQAAAAIAVSATAKDYIARHGVARSRIHLVVNGVPGRPSLVERPTPRGHWTLGCVALFRPRKGIDVLFGALSMLRDRGATPQLRLIGGFETPAYEADLRRLAERLRIAPQVEWRGFQSDVQHELGSLDLLVLPSILAEGMPMVVLEAMAAGVPTVGSRVAGVADVIEHGVNGMLAEPQDAQSLADTIYRVIDGDFDWQMLRRQGFATHAKRYSDRSMAAGVAEVYRKVLAP